MTVSMVPYAYCVAIFGLEYSSISVLNIVCDVNAKAIRGMMLVMFCENLIMRVCGGG